MTVRGLAKEAGVSERQMYYVLRLRRSGRKDLVGAVASGRLTIHAAIRQIEPPRPKDGLKLLINAWQQANEDERAVFVALLRKAGVEVEDGA